MDKIVQKQIQQLRCEVGTLDEDVDDQNLQYYCMAINFRNFAILADQSRNLEKFILKNFTLKICTVHTQYVATCQHMTFSHTISCSVVVSLWLPTDIFKLWRNLVSSYPILVVLSRDQYLCRRSYLPTRKCRVCWKARTVLRVGERDSTTPSSLPN